MENSALDHDLDATEMIGIERAGVRCALPMTWSRAVVDEFELVAVPRAPDWLAGVTSVDGIVSPVVDLAAFSESEHSKNTNQGARRNRRLLVGGLVDESGNQSLSFLFDGLPVQFQAAVGSAAHLTIPADLASAIVGVCSPKVTDMPYWVLDSSRVYQTLGTLLNR